MCYGCVQVCAVLCIFVCWHPTFQLFFFLFFALPATAVSCRLYRTVPQGLELSAAWQPRYNTGRTASLRGPHMRVLALHMRVRDVCAMI